MRIAARRRSEWMLSSHDDAGRHVEVHVGGEWVDVVQLGQGDPIVLVPGLAGGWKLLAPLATRLARHYQVTIPGLGCARFRRGAASVRDRPAPARDLASILGQRGLEPPTLFGVSF